MVSSAGGRHTSLDWAAGFELLLPSYRMRHMVISPDNQATGALVMIRQARVPYGSWPLEMRAETAAAYVDEPSVEAFWDKVHRGVYCAPMKEKGCLPKWHRHKLDRDIALRHGLSFDNVALMEDASELI